MRNLAYTYTRNTFHYKLTRRRHLGKTPFTDLGNVKMGLRGDGEESSCVLSSVAIIVVFKGGFFPSIREISILTPRSARLDPPTEFSPQNTVKKQSGI